MKMNIKHKTKVFGFIAILSLLFSACAPGQLFGSTLTPTSTLTPIPTPTSTATRTPIPTPTSTATLTPVPTNTSSPTVAMPSITITTATGDIVITEVKFVSKDAEGKTASPGYQIFNILFKNADGSDINLPEFFTASQDVYIKGDDGSKTTMYTVGLAQASAGYFLTDEGLIGFMPPANAHKFTLFWPGNAPIELPIP